MAVSTINPYSGGAVVFNQQPWMAFYERQMMRQQARNDAQENYFRELNKSVTPTGMRQQDISSLLQKNKDWQMKYQQNKAAILNPRLDGGKAYSEYMSGYQDQLGLIDQSKEAKKDLDEIGKMKLNPQLSYVFEDPHFFEQVQKHELPIGHPDRQGIDLATMFMPDKPIDTKEMTAHQAYLTGGLKPDAIPGAPINIGNFQTQTPITHAYNDQNLKAIGDRSMQVYDTDRKWRTQANKTMTDIMHDPIKHDQLNTVYKRIYGKDIDSPKEALAAEDILSNQIHSVEYKPGQDIYGRDLAMARVHHNYRMSELEWKESMKDKTSQEQNDYAETLYNTLKEDAKKNPRAAVLGGKTVNQYEIQTGGILSKAFALPGHGGHLIYPDYFRYSNDMKTVTPIFLEHKTNDFGERTPEVLTGKDGKAKVITELSRPLLESEFKQQYKKQLMGVSAYGKTLLTHKKNTKEKSAQEDKDPLSIF